MSGDRRYPARAAWEAALLFVVNVAHCCERIAVAGSLRRWDSASYRVGHSLPDCTVGDIEIVAIPRMEAGVNLLWQRCEAAYQPRWVVDRNGRGGYRLGAKQRKYLLPPIGWVTGDDPDDLFPGDIYTATRENWGYIYALRTGPSAWNLALVKQRAWGGLLPPEITLRGGTVWRGGEPVAVPEEEDFFRALGLAWLPPHEREQVAPAQARAA